MAEICTIEITDEMVERAAQTDWAQSEDKAERQHGPHLGSYERTAWEDANPDRQVSVRAAIRRILEIALYGAEGAAPSPAPWLTGAKQPAPEDTVQILMTEAMARRFEDRCLGANTTGDTQLSPPVCFRDDETPTYIIQVNS